MRESIRFTIMSLVFITLIIAAIAWPLYGVLTVAALLFAVGLYDIFQTKHTILRNFPLIGHMRYLLEWIAPEIHQYFVENDVDGKPIDRNHRTYVYERAKLENQNHPYGTELEVEAENYKWMRHTLYPPKPLDEPPRVHVGGPDCVQPYESSLFNISAMSYGALSKNAIMALNKGAQAGGFFHDTGEGGLTEYHLLGGDVVWEVGTGYFGCRTGDGNFDPEKFKENSRKPAVKMVELKLSQGAKPGHGGVLPASKNNEEIARIRGVEPHTRVLSPPGHSAFNDARGLLEFVQQLRELCGGKPVGFKLCIGSTSEFEELCRLMVETGIKPDFITVDGAEGGTGAAPIDFSNYVGMPWEKALLFVVDTLNGFGLKKDIRVLTATKIFTAFDIFKALCIGADICSTARGMMLALGCIQALRCHENTCPTGVTSNKKSLMRGLVVEEKWKRVQNYQRETLKEFLQLFAAAGCTTLEHPNRSMIYKRIGDENRCYQELYPEIAAGSFLEERAPTTTA